VHLTYICFVRIKEPDTVCSPRHKNFKVYLIITLFVKRLTAFFVGRYVITVC